MVSSHPFPFRPLFLSRCGAGALAAAHCAPLGVLPESGGVPPLSYPKEVMIEKAFFVTRRNSDPVRDAFFFFLSGWLQAIHGSGVIL